MTHVHLIGTGLSSLPGIRRLANNLENLTIWNRTLEKAENSINHVNKNNVKAKKFDIDLIAQEIFHIRTNGSFHGTTSVAIDPNGHVLVTSKGDGKIGMWK